MEILPKLSISSHILCLIQIIIIMKRFLIPFFWVQRFEQLTLQLSHLILLFLETNTSELNFLRNRKKIQIWQPTRASFRAGMHTWYLDRRTRISSISHSFQFRWKYSNNDWDWFNDVDRNVKMIRIPLESYKLCRMIK